MQNIEIVYTTVGSVDEAKHLAQTVLDARLAFCVNIIPQGVSMYLWKNIIQTSSETYMLFKTTQEVLEAILTCIKQHHPYETPFIGFTTLGIRDDICAYLEDWKRKG